jgi:hypothetical protein
MYTVLQIDFPNFQVTSVKWETCEICKDADDGGLGSGNHYMK